MKLWGVDLGGTKIEGAILDPAHPEKALFRLRVPTEAHLGYEHILSQISKLISQLEEASGLPRPEIIGFGTPGATEPSTGALKNSNTVCLNGKPLRNDLSRMLGVEARLANDGNCLALAEATLGAGKGCLTVMGLILGTGVGGGIVVDEKIIEGLHGIGGEWGHNPMRGEDHPCYCGRRGCVEKVLAGPSLERFYREQTGQTVRLPEIVKLAGEGQPAAVATLERLRDKFGEAIAVIIKIRAA